MVDLSENDRFYNVSVLVEKTLKPMNDSWVERKETMAMVRFLFSHIVSEESRLAALSLLKRNQHRQLIDFDNHLDSMSNDWRNPHIRNELTASPF